MTPRVNHDELKLMAEVGLMAATQGDVSAAKAIFAAVEQERPEAAVAYIGPALANLFTGNPAEAIDGLQRGLAAVAQEDRPDLQAVLSIAFQVSGRVAEGVEALQAAGGTPLAQAIHSKLHHQASVV